MKKIAILTFNRELNYGAVLQSHGLYKTLTDLGHAVEFINLDLKNSKPKIGFIKKIKSNLGQFRQLFIHKNFSKSRRVMLGSSSNDKIYNSQTNLLNDFKHIDLFIVGSDQVWNKEITGKIAFAYFFDFLNDLDLNRISYAASFGSSNWGFSKNENKIINNLLNQFKTISVRETNAIDMLSSNVNIKNAVQVLDPSLLLDNLDHLVKKSNFKSLQKYVFVFSFYKQFTPSDLKFIKDRFGLNIKIFSYNLKYIYDKDYITHYTLSPLDFIKIINDSEFIITDSYHASITAIHLKKQFFVIKTEKGKSRFNRISNLLNDLKLDDRIWEDDIVKEIKLSEINWPQVKRIIDEKKVPSINFLKTNLN